MEFHYDQGGVALVENGFDMANKKIGEKVDDGPLIKKVSPVDTSYPYFKNLWKIRAKEGDTMPTTPEQKGPGGETIKFDW